ncbi:MAG: three-Cys-motif partner protein TcmP [Eggerthellaceae bacterium]|nr:three-Cys-motif partner protein TcmP [Eggerthellaceae bacterium]
MARNSRFFDDKHPWSETKDALLGNYLTPFFTKVYNASRDGIIYVDAFAGPGRFKDGTIGSPLLALEKYQAVCKSRRAKRPIQFVFGEAKRGLRRQLEANATDATNSVGYIKQPIIKDSFDEAMDCAVKVAVVGRKRPSTYFYYVDPFGFKYLRMAALLESPNPNHTEVLVNFNTVGFIRDACEALRIAIDVPSGIEILDVGFDDADLETERIQRLNAAIGSDEWKSIIEAVRDKSMNYWEAEYRISQLFCCNARRKYAYVTSMPIKDMSRMVALGGEIKYRLVHMTNNADGCILMNDEMLRRKQNQQDTLPGFLTLDVDGKDVQPEVVQQAMRDAVMQYPVGKQFQMRWVAAYVISRCGVFMNGTTLLRTYLKQLIEEGLIERVDKYRKDGKPRDNFAKETLVYRSPTYQTTIEFDGSSL